MQSASHNQLVTTSLNDCSACNEYQRASVGGMCPHHSLRTILDDSEAYDEYQHQDLEAGIELAHDRSLEDQAERTW